MAGEGPGEVGARLASDRPVVAGQAWGIGSFYGFKRSSSSEGAISGTLSCFTC